MKQSLKFFYESNKQNPLNGGKKNKLKEQNIFLFKKSFKMAIQYLSKFSKKKIIKFSLLVFHKATYTIAILINMI